MLIKLQMHFLYVYDDDENNSPGLDWDLECEYSWYTQPDEVKWVSRKQFFYQYIDFAMTTSFFIFPSFALI